MSVGSASSGCSGRSRKSKESTKFLSVADVYDIAADIGKEFECLIESHGPDHVTQLMQKVICALEHLERMSAARDSEEQTIDNLRTTIEHLELEDSKKNEERHRNAQELELVEEHYKQETRDLLTTVKKLQAENRKLVSSLAAANERDSAFSEDESYLEVELVNRLENTLEKQRCQIKELDRSVIDYKTENEELKKQNDKLNICTKDLRRKVRTTQSQLHNLVDERADLTAKTHDQHREIQNLHRQLGRAAQECQELSQTTGFEGKVVFDENDPERPRFSLPELRDILQERNALKAKLSDLEDELAVYRPRPQQQAYSSTVSPSRLKLASSLATPVCNCSYHSGKGEDDPEESIECEELDELADEDLPVQGPLPRDPDDAPWKRNETGIRKLFYRAFGSARRPDGNLRLGNQSESQSFTRRSLSRLSHLVAPPSIDLT